jgi:hypothetical protein
MTLFRIYTFTGAMVIAAASSLFWLVGGRKKTPEEREVLRETQRRQRINAQGHITDGTVLEVKEFDPDTDHSTQMVIYTYGLAGVEYECSQDVTRLHPFFDLPSCRIGVVTSVKYDPHNPANSIVVAETWCGLRT